MRALWFGVLMAAACSQRTEIAIDYRLGNIDLASLVRVETYVSVDPSDARAFYADQPYRSVADGVGYEVRDFDMSGQRTLLITHDSTLGYVFAPAFTFTLLPPASETAPPLVFVARAVGASTMLGRTMPVPGKFAPGAHVTVALMDQRCAGVACGSDETCCNDVCTNLLTSAGNCGACGMACEPGGDSCQGGNCLCAGASGCSAGKSCCSGTGCVDLSGDPFNCGSCGNACNPGETCAGGQCACDGTAACGAGGLCCPGSGCSMNGSCPCGGSTCALPNTCCNDSSCVDLSSDNANCGACGHTCSAGLACQNGACKCSGQICSMGDTCCPTGCADLTSSTNNCGACGHACAPNETCTGGTCKCGTTTCTAGQTCCGTTCKNLDGDVMNCGACGKACNAGEQCVSGVCLCPGTQPPRGCAPNQTCCGGATGAAAGCFDLSSDQGHCGSCTIACTSSQECSMGVCRQSSCNPACTNGNTCDPTTLKCVCGTSAGCSDPLYCCGAACVNRLTDARNCGQCNNDVRPNLCCNGQSTPNDVFNCGGCGTFCNAAQFCCKVSGNFACVDNDLNNCGGCGNVCTTKTCCTCGRMGSCQVTCPVNICLP